MRETVGSLQAYFIFVSASGLINGVGALGTPQAGSVNLIALAFLVAYLYIGITLRKLLVQSPKLIENTLLATMAFQAIELPRNLANGFELELVGRLLIILVLWYLLTNVRRLSKELKSKA